MMDGSLMFQDRRDAGRQLAQALTHYKEVPTTSVLALPRGGVILADELSQGLHLPLEVILRGPGNPELAMGALAETGYRHLNHLVLCEHGVSERQLEEEGRRQQEEISRQAGLYRNGKPLPALSGQTIILMDDGLATGATFYALLAVLRALAIGRLIAAIPMAPPQATTELASKPHETVILGTAQRFYAIGFFYEDFSQMSDEEVIACLARGRKYSLDH